MLCLFCLLKHICLVSVKVLWGSCNSKVSALSWHPLNVTVSMKVTTNKDYHCDSPPARGNKYAMHCLMQKQMHVPIFVHSVAHYDCGSNYIQKATHHFLCINLELPFKSTWSQRQKHGGQKNTRAQNLFWMHVNELNFQLVHWWFRKANLVEAVEDIQVKLWTSWLC